MRRVLPLVLALAVLLVGRLPAAQAAPGRPLELRGATVHLFQTGDTVASTIRQLKLLKRAGGTMARIELPLALFWTSRHAVDEPSVARITTVFRAARRLGIKVLAIVGGTPCWASQRSPADLAYCQPYSASWTKAV